MREQIALLSGLLDSHAPRVRTAADLGAGAGRVVELLLGRGATTVYGCEIDPARAKQARELGGRIDTADMRTWAPPEQVDVVTCVEVIEHLPARDQINFLHDSRSWLSNSGVMILSTPQRNSPVAFAERAYCRCRGLEYDWWDPTHISVLTKRDLERLFRVTGWEVVELAGLHLVPEAAAKLHPLLGRLAKRPLRRRAAFLSFDLIYVLAPADRGSRR